MNNKTERNYELDILKLIFTFCVVISHTGGYIGEETRFRIPSTLGQLSVYFFFVVSGMLLVNSHMKRGDGMENSRSGMTTVLKKFKGISYEYWTALGITAAVYVAILLMQNTSPVSLLVKMIPEIFALREGGLAYQYIISPAWYISAMLIAMLPLSYMLEKNSGFYIYVFSPLAGLLTLGYIYNTYTFTSRDFTGIVLTTLIRALAGLCIGSISWIISNKLNTLVKKKAQRIVLTILEVLLYGLFFAVWFTTKDNLALYSMMLILPIAVGITFSSTSYISELFKFKWLNKVGGLSLAIYLNHANALRIVNQLFPGRSYKTSLLLLFAITAASCVVYYLIIFLVKKLWNEKLHKVLVE